VIRRIFIDPTASHLIISTTLGENFYLHNQSRQPKPLGSLKGVIECIAWNPSLPTASTREILVGLSDGNIYETFVEPLGSAFRRREEKFVKLVYKVPDGSVRGLWVDDVQGKADVKRVMVATAGTLLHFTGKVGRQGHGGSEPIYTKLFETETAVSQENGASPSAGPSTFTVSPDAPTISPETIVRERTFGWLSSQGVVHGKLLTSPAGAELGNRMYTEARLLPRSQLPSADDGPRRRSAQHNLEPLESILLTQWHIIALVGGRIIAINTLDDTVVYDQVVLDHGQSAIGLVADQKQNTFWLFTTEEIFEITVHDEDRDVWKIMLQEGQFDAALQYAKTPAQKDAVATASGDHLVSTGAYLEAAGVYGKSSKPFEEVSLAFIDHGDQDALRKYLSTKLTTYKRSSIMQRIMIASWLVEIFMSKLNSLDDTITTKADVADTPTAAETEDQLSTIRKEFQDFVSKNKGDLDRKTTYDIISSHGREDELLFYATSVNDYNYVLAYWVQRERWTETLNVLKRQVDPEIFYKYSSVLMSHVPVDLVDILTRQSNLNPRNLIPALLNYNRNARVSLAQNQAVRYLLYVINQLRSTDAAVHNTLISIFASNPSKEESSLLSYLETHSHNDKTPYDADFALRLCIEHRRVQSCVHIYSSMGQYFQAVELALRSDEVDLASFVADKPEENPTLRKKLWLAVAKKVISQSDGGIKTAIEILKRCELLKIEDLIPFFPDFVVIDDFKEEICSALEEYSRHIDSLKKEMDESAKTANNIRVDIAALDCRYAIVEPGERCYVCQYPLLSRQFFVFPCQHAFHSDCLSKEVMKQAGMGKSKKIKDLQTDISRGLTAGAAREKAIGELDSLIAASW
jgi:vacuolar protein sorting-associated protein 18